MNLFTNDIYTQLQTRCFSQQEIEEMAAKVLAVSDDEVLQFWSLMGDGSWIAQNVLNMHKLIGLRIAEATQRKYISEIDGDEWIAEQEKKEVSGTPDQEFEQTVKISGWGLPRILRSSAPARELSMNQLLEQYHIEDAQKEVLCFEKSEDKGIWLLDQQDQEINVAVAVEIFDKVFTQLSRWHEQTDHRDIFLDPNTLKVVTDDTGEWIDEDGNKVDPSRLVFYSVMPTAFVKGVWQAADKLVLTQFSITGRWFEKRSSDLSSLGIEREETNEKVLAILERELNR